LNGCGDNYPAAIFVLHIQAWRLSYKLFVTDDVSTGKDFQLMTQFGIATDYIKLDSFLKLVNIVGSGGEAKIIIADGQVAVNGETEMRRGRKLYPGDRVALGDHEFFVSSER
jgi:ribosome-associated protein